MIVILLSDKKLLEIGGSVSFHYRNIKVFETEL